MCVQNVRLSAQVYTLSNARRRQWNPVLSEPCFGVPTQFYHSQFLYLSRVLIKKLNDATLAPWAFWVICRLRPPLPKFHFWPYSSLKVWDRTMQVVSHLGFQGLWFWLDIFKMIGNMNVHKYAKYGSTCPKWIKPKLLGMENFIQVENTTEGWLSNDTIICQIIWQYQPQNLHN